MIDLDEKGLIVALTIEYANKQTELLLFSLIKYQNLRLKTADQSQY